MKLGAIRDFKPFHFNTVEYLKNSMQFCTSTELLFLKTPAMPITIFPFVSYLYMHEEFKNKV